MKKINREHREHIILLQMEYDSRLPRRAVTHIYTLSSSPSPQAEKYALQQLMVHVPDLVSEYSKEKENE